MENIKLPQEWQQEADRSSINNICVYDQSDRIARTNFSYGFKEGAQSMLTAVEIKLKERIPYHKGNLSLENEIKEILTELKSIHP